MFLVLLVSISAFAQEEILSEPFTRSISKDDLPIGKSFIAFPLDGSPAFAGIVDATTISFMPINTPFILKVSGRESKRINILDKKSLKN